MRASVIITTRDRPDHLRMCLETVRQAVSQDDEIIIVDSASREPDGARAIAREKGARFLTCQLPGAARARNVGIRHARGEIIAFTDDDVLVDSAWLDHLCSGFRGGAIDVVVGPVFKIGSDPPSPLYEYRTFKAAEDCLSFSRTSDGWFDRLNFGAIGSGANLAVRRRAFEQFGYFRECLGAGAPIPGDETFFLFDVVMKGGVAKNQPSAKVFHPDQTEERIREVEQARLAYLLFVVLDRPGSVPRIAWKVWRRLWQRHESQKLVRSELGERSSVLRKVLVAPSLLLSAWRFCRQS